MLDEGLTKTGVLGVEVLAQRRRFHRAGEEGIHANTGSEVGSHRPGQLRFGRLAGVMREMGAYRLADHDRADVDDGSAGAVEQMRDRQPRQLERYRHVEVECLLQVLDPRVEERRRDLTPCVVDENVEAAQFLHRPIDEPGEPVQVLDVGGQ